MKKLGGLFVGLCTALTLYMTGCSGIKSFSAKDDIGVGEIKVFKSQMGGTDLTYTYRGRVFKDYNLDTKIDLGLTARDSLDNNVQSAYKHCLKNAFDKGKIFFYKDFVFDPIPIFSQELDTPTNSKAFEAKLTMRYMYDHIPYIQIKVHDMFHPRNNGTMIDFDRKMVKKWKKENNNGNLNWEKESKKGDLSFGHRSGSMTRALMTEIYFKTMLMASQSDLVKEYKGGYALKDGFFLQ